MAKIIKVTIETPDGETKRLKLRSVVMGGVNDDDNGDTTACAFLGRPSDIVQAFMHVDDHKAEIVKEIFGDMLDHLKADHPKESKELQGAKLKGVN